MTAESMRRSAREANEESHRMAQARRLGEAVGHMAAFIRAINDLTDRIEALEKLVGTMQTPSAEAPAQAAGSTQTGERGGV